MVSFSRRITRPPGYDFRLGYQAPFVYFVAPCQLRITRNGVVLSASEKRER